jgi:hypothetical protein
LIEGVDHLVSGPFSMRMMTPGGELSVPLAEVGGEELLGATPVRKPKIFPNQKNMPGKSFCSTNGDFVEYESLLERDWILVKDFDPRVTRILEQPFELEYQLGERRATHVPDLLIWAGDSVIVSDVKPARRRHEPRFVLQAEATRDACSQLGWEFEVLSEPDPLFMTNLRWIGGYRDEPIDSTSERVRMLNRVTAGPATIGELISGASEPLLARPVLMHLIWVQEVRIDLEAPMNDQSVVRRSSGED